MFLFKVLRDLIIWLFVIITRPIVFVVSSIYKGIATVVIWILKKAIKSFLMTLSWLYGETLVEHIIFICSGTFIYSLYKNLEVISLTYLKNVEKLNNVITFADVSFLTEFNPVIQKLWDWKKFGRGEIRIKWFEDFTFDMFNESFTIARMDLPGLVYVLIIILILLFVIIFSWGFYLKSMHKKISYKSKIEKPISKIIYDIDVYYGVRRSGNDKKTNFKGDTIYEYNK